MIARKVQEAADSPHDVIVVGGGIQGASLALEAARRGLRVLLVERDDFGGATSANSFGIIHGGLRYLQTLGLRRSRESAGELAWFLRCFPELVRPSCCLMPLYGDHFRSPTAFRIAFALHEALTRWPSRDAGSGGPPPRGAILGVDETSALFPSVDRRGLRGSALWYDGVMVSPQRVLIEMLHWACHAGAIALNYVEATALLRSAGRVAGIEAFDRVGSSTLEFRAPIVVNCVGPRSHVIARAFDRGVPDLFRPMLAFNVLLDRPPVSAAAIAASPRRRGGRAYLVRGLGGCTLAGTFQGPWTRGVGAPRPTSEQVAALLGDLNEAIPGLDVTESDVLRIHAGLLPAPRAGSGTPATRDVVHDHARTGGPKGLFSVIGVKYTMARRVAERALRRICPEVAPSSAIRRGAERPCPTAGLDLVDPLPLFQASRADTGARVRSLAECEAVVDPDDLLFRRTSWADDPRRVAAVGHLIREALGPGRGRPGPAVRSPSARRAGVNHPRPISEIHQP